VNPLTLTTIVTDASTLIANVAPTQGAVDATGTAAAVTAAVTDPAAIAAANSTQSVTLADIAPTWTSVDPDPLASAISLLQSLGGVKE